MLGMFSKTTFLAGAAAGYVLGARAGRERYEKIKSFVKDPDLPAPVEKAYRAASDKAQDMMGMASDSSRQDSAADSAPPRRSPEDNGHHIPSPAELAENMPATHL
jgi:hypothetical protein